MCEMDLRSNALINRTELSHSGRGFCGRLECSQERARFTLWKGDSIGQFVEPTPPITSGSKPRLISFSSPDQHFALPYRQLTKNDRRLCQLDRLDQLHFRCPRVIKWLLRKSVVYCRQIKDASVGSMERLESGWHEPT